MSCSGQYESLLTVSGHSLANVAGVDDLAENRYSSLPIIIICYINIYNNIIFNTISMYICAHYKTDCRLFPQSTQEIILSRPPGINAFDRDWVHSLSW